MLLTYSLGGYSLGNRCRYQVRLQNAFDSSHDQSPNVSASLDVHESIALNLNAPQVCQRSDGRRIVHVAQVGKAPVHAGEIHHQTKRVDGSETAEQRQQRWLKHIVGNVTDEELIIIKICT